ncbi:uncharacterized protein TRUGW13939_02826 [Talaromyces rugulosus]|uniref:Uncharacterized protein n=1 Tax=Talaromyces rugulosus TaxID=121627 RepID=A0A7H8QPE0_TALRU|nr:uncharacterized protein TRUGW13939_02826 [Talaromyces rugulosus]QKX55729.1 hypothetical protein TRUGW13939_02826 [Talaromyces rugulosus]
MLFNLGFTADAAAAHAEEEKTTTTKPRRLIMPLPSLPDLFASKNSTPTPTPPLSSKPSHQTITSLSADNNDDEDNDDDDDNDDANPTTTVPRPATARARAARPKTLFQFAHPVASQRHRRLTLRPKLLLQLHESSAMSRPFPKYDVLPASIAPRLACKFPKLFASLRGLGPRDLVVVTSDMYEQHVDDDRSDWSEDSSQDQREIVATIRQPLIKDDPQSRCASVEIVSGLGTSWTGVPLPNGSYELVCSADLQQKQRKARWVARDKGIRKASGSGNNSSVDGLKRFTFSVIDPNSRRHPVIASLTRNGIDVFEQYAYPAAVSSSDETSSSPPQSPRELIDLDEELRVLIVTSGIWIAFMEGWAKNSSDALCPTEASQPSLRSKSSTFPGAERNPPNERFLSAADASSRTTKNRSSTQSEVGPLRQGTLRAAKSRYRQSLSAENHDQKWTNLQKHEADAESEIAAENNQASKGKSWRRLSAMFGKNKGS